MDKMTPATVEKLLAAGWRLVPPAASQEMIAAAWAAARAHNKSPDAIYTAVVDSAQNELPENDAADIGRERIPKNTSLSFAPRFHRQVMIGSDFGWSVLLSTFGDPLLFAAEIHEEQRRIEGEGGKIFCVDLKHS